MNFVAANHRRSLLPLAMTCVIASAVAVEPSMAHAYRTLADDPEIAAAVPITLADSTYRWELAAAGLDRRTADGVLVELDSGIASWTSPACTGLRAVLLGEAEHAVPGDGRSTIELVREGWGARGLEDAHGATADVQLESVDGGPYVIREVDIYVDLEHFDWSFESPRSDALSLEVAIRHEMGHALGLLHVCELDGVGGAPVCDGSYELQRSVMHPVYAQSSGLAADDVAGVCALYPRESSTCAGGCAVGAHCEHGECVPDCAAPARCDGSCLTDGDCAEGRCSQTGGAEGQCVAGGDHGTSCGRGEEFASGLCLMGSTRGSICTATCRDASDCEAAERCVRIGAEQVCAPPPPAGTCSVSPGGGVGPRGLLALFGLVSVWVGLRRRGRGAQRG